MAKDSQFIVAAFDFDGTLTYSDSLVPFFLFSVGYFKTFVNLLLEVPLFILYLLGYKSRQQVKEALLYRFFKEKNQQELQHLGKDFAEKKIKKLLKPEAISRIKWHQQQKHQCILVSANLDLYLEPWGNLVGFDQVICSKVEFTPEGKLTGHLVGKNCRSVEKVRRLEKNLGPKENYFLYAYGDSEGDKELLALADVSYYRRLA